jgi:prolycopene isomerase
MLCSLDPSLAPAGRHIIHAFTPDWIDAWQVRRNQQQQQNNGSSSSKR